MTTIVSLGMAVQPETLYVVNADLRSYLGLSRDGGYVHHIRPVRLEEPIVASGLRDAGDLTCDCRGGDVRGTCYWTKRAEDYERGIVRHPDWFAGETASSAIEQGVAVFDAPAGAGEAVEAWRG